MIRYLLDECVTGHLAQALREARPPVEFVTVREAGIAGLKDPEVLLWAARERRVVVTLDVRTMPNAFWALLDQGMDPFGLVVLAAGVPIRQVVEELTLMAHSTDGDVPDRLITRLPL